MDSTIRSYLTAASVAITTLTGKPCSIKMKDTAGSKNHPYLAEIISQTAAWKEPKPRKEIFTQAMFNALKQQLRSHSLTTATHQAVPLFCSLKYAVYDWTRLGLFTGSRISEYGQAKVQKGQRFATIPHTKNAHQWAGWPIAFIASDFTFYDRNLIKINHDHCLSPSQALIIYEVHIRFRYDKSTTNFSVRKYRRISTAPFDPVRSAINIIKRALIIQIPKNEPIGQYLASNAIKSSSRLCLRDYHIRDVMRAACKQAYPNPQHYYRLHINSIVAHSNRVTAAVCLKMGGATDEDIAYRLRWHISSVPTYLRECASGIDSIMQKAIAGSILNT